MATFSFSLCVSLCVCKCELPAHTNLADITGGVGGRNSDMPWRDIINESLQTHHHLLCEIINPESSGSRLLLFCVHFLPCLTMLELF